MEATNPDDPQRRTFAECIAETLANLALRGNVRAASELCDRVEGKPRQSVAVSRDEEGISLYLESSNARLDVESLEAELRSLTDDQLMEALHQAVQLELSSDLEGFAEEAWPRIGEQSKLVPAKYWSAICEHLMAVSIGQIRRLIITVPPRHGKSTLVQYAMAVLAVGARRGALEVAIHLSCRRPEACATRYAAAI